jgi:hypothetical protein
MRAKHQLHESTGWDAACWGHSPAIRAESSPWVRTTPLIIGLSALLWEVVFGLARWLAALQV